jgi:hypothetical protein
MSNVKGNNGAIKQFTGFTGFTGFHLWLVPWFMPWVNI